MGEGLSSDLYENSKLFLYEFGEKSFLLKMGILFGVYLILNYLYDKLGTDELVKTFSKNPNITISIPNHITFRLVIVVLMFLSSHYVYDEYIREYVNPNN